MPTEDSPISYVPTTGPVPKNLQPCSTFMHHNVKIGPAEARALLGALPRAVSAVPENFPRHPKVIIVDANGEVADGASVLWELIREGLGYTLDVLHNMPVGATDRIDAGRHRAWCHHMEYAITTDDRVLLDAGNVIAWLKGAVVMGRKEPVIELLIAQLVEELTAHVQLLRDKWQGPRVQRAETTEPGQLSLVHDAEADDKGRW